MRLEAVRALARERGIAADKMRKIELVRVIQRIEGHAECFGRIGDNVCLQWDCLWREDCLPARVRSSERPPVAWENHRGVASSDADETEYRLPVSGLSVLGKGNY